VGKVRQYVLGGILVVVGAETTLSDFSDFRVTHLFFQFQDYKIAFSPVHF
jgi:hypothetical protein